MRQMDLLPLAAHADGAASLVGALANAQPPAQKVPQQILWFYDVILFQAEPQWRHLLRPDFLSCRNQHLHTLCSEVIVGEVHLLNAGALLTKIGKAFCSIVVEVIPVQLDDLQLWTAATDVQDSAQTHRCQLIL